MILTSPYLYCIYTYIQYRYGLLYFYNISGKEGEYDKGRKRYKEI